ncbi:phage portal protein family protein [Bacillus cereus group sp. MYBK12-2]|uniref:phage portal protein family protein n=1 Tax=Bacillus cereus group sp. MYBK12-2 TaxID=3450689 RepID=UPI003F79C380
MIQRDMLLFAEQKKDREKPVFTEIGSRSSDLDVTSDGRLHDKDEISLDTYRKMRKDPQVKACLLVMKLPILQLSWSLQAKTEEGKRISGWCEMMLSEYMDDSLPYYTREMLTALDFGRSITEKIWQLKMVPIDPDNPDSIKVEERIIPLKLKTYDPRNITIKMDPDTLQLEGALQHTGRSEIFIPANKLLIYSHEKEFNNYYGASVLQAAYKPWIIKEFLQRFWNIALERYGTPLSTMQIPQGGSISKAIALMDMVKTKAGIPLPEGYEMEIHNLANAGMSFKEAIEYQDVMIARSMLVPDLIFANSGSGAYALSQTHEGFFEMRLNGISQELGDIYTKYLIRPMVQYNFGEVREYPEFTYSKVGREDLQKLADIVDKLLKGKVIAPSESWIRERMGVPPTK